MIKYTLLFAMALIVFFSSCDEDSFSQVVTIEVPEHTPLPALKLILLPNDTSARVLVSNSKGILDPESSYDLPSDAEVQLFKNGNLMLDFTFNPEEQLYVSSIPDGIVMEAGDTYRLAADLKNFEAVEVEQVVPPRPVISNARYELEGTIDPGGYRVDELIVDLEDAEPGETNYYGVNLFQVYYDININGDTIGVYRNSVGLDTNDPLLEYGNSYGLIFNDEIFSGGTYQLRCYTYYSLGDEADLEVEIYQLTKDAFLFTRSLSQYYDAIDNPFAEPVTVHNNVEGGYGVFVLANKTVFPLN